MLGPPEVSVVIPTHNRAQTIVRSIQSVLAQSFENLEVIVVDDGSTDATENMVTSLADARISYVRHEANQGACAARNTGIAHARADLIAFQDSDDEWARDKLEKQMALIGSLSPKPVVVYCGFIRREGVRDVYVPGADVIERRGWILDQLLSGNFVSTQTMLVPKECFDKVGGFLPELKRLQDWELAIRLAGSYEFELVDEPLVTAYATAGSITDDTLALVGAIEMILDRHLARYAKFPKQEAELRIHLAHHLCALGRMAAGRRHFRRAMKLGHGLVFAGAAWALSFLGKNIYRRIFRRSVAEMRLP